MKCACCGREFTAQRSTRRFCSDRCRIKNHRPSRIEKYNELVAEYNGLLEESNVVAGDLNKAVACLLSIAGEPNKAKRADRLNKITMTLMVAGWFEQQMAIKAEKPES